jgi:hypothetical protein
LTRAGVYRHYFSSMTEWNVFDMSVGLDSHTNYPETTALP